MKILLFIALLIGLCYSNSINSCVNISQSGSYVLSSDLFGAPNAIQTETFTFSKQPYCLKIESSNVDLDCLNHSIFSTDPLDFFAIIVTGNESFNLNNITIRNCRTSGYLSSVFLKSNNNITIHNLVSDKPYYGVYVYRTNFVTISNSVFFNATKYGIFAVKNSSNLYLENDSVLWGPKPVIDDGNSLNFFDSGYYFNGENISLSNVSAINTTGNGFLFENVSNLRIVSSLAQGNSGHGFWIWGSKNVSFDNDVSSLDDIGFVIDNSNSVNLTSTESSNNTQGIYFSYSNNLSVSNIISNSNRICGFCFFTGSNVSVNSIISCNNHHSQLQDLNPSSDILFKFSSSYDLSNTTCNNSYPNGLCDNPCPILSEPDSQSIKTNPNSGNCLSMLLFLPLFSFVYFHNRS